MGDAALLSTWRTAWSRPTQGWSFAEFGDRLLVEEPPWSYDGLARSVLGGATSALDLGTGGGEVLLRLADALPPDTVATEGWPPNLPVAEAALGPHGIPVVFYDAEGGDPRLPFEDARFDVVLDRHEAYVAAEVARVLAPGGRLLTQQVAGDDLEEIRRLFGAESDYLHITLDNLRVEAEAAGLVVEAAESFTGTQRFADVETLVGYLRMVPWEAPEDFSVDGFAGTLLDLHRRLTDDPDALACTTSRFYLVCRRPD